MVLQLRSFGTVGRLKKQIGRTVPSCCSCSTTAPSSSTRAPVIRLKSLPSVMSQNPETPVLRTRQSLQQCLHYLSRFLRPHKCHALFEQLVKWLCFSRHFREEFAVITQPAHERAQLTNVRGHRQLLECFYLLRIRRYTFCGDPVAQRLHYLYPQVRFLWCKFQIKIGEPFEKICKSLTCSLPFSRSRLCHQ